MLFDFQLCPLEHVTSWEMEGRPTLHWFGFTEGRYWMRVGHEDLFRYTEDSLTRWPHPTLHRVNLPYVDYYVVRLWEDIQEMLPHLLEPVPQAVLEHFRLGVQAITWREGMIASIDSSDIADDLLDCATSWVDQRRLDVGYLQDGPRIWLWTDGADVFVHWDNRAIQREGVLVWTATEGTMMLPLQSFIDEVYAFDQRFIQAMYDRVEIIHQHWPRPDVQIDFAQLLQEQKERAMWMEQALLRARSKPATDWDMILRSIERLEHGDFAH